MPTIYRFDGFRFFFYSNEGNEPPHVHVSKGGGELKVWLGTLSLDYCYGFTNADRKIILKIVQNNKKRFQSEWMKFYERSI